MAFLHGLYENSTEQGTEKNSLALVLLRILRVSLVLLHYMYITSSVYSCRDQG